MEVSRTTKSNGVFRFMDLPPELRLKVYAFAVFRATPIELQIKFHGGGPRDPNNVSRVRLYTDQDFRMLAVSRESRKDMLDAMYSENTFDISPTFGLVLTRCTGTTTFKRSWPTWFLIDIRWKLCSSSVISNGPDG